MLLGIDKNNINFTEIFDDLIKMIAFHSLNIVRGREKTIQAFFTHLPPELK